MNAGVVINDSGFISMKHEEKRCQRCDTTFECKVGSISLCQCSSVILNDDERSYMREKYSDCLCSHCMIELRSEFHFRKLTDKLRRLLRKITS